ncbi:gas vesicle protein [Streptomyces sp. NPDC048664]|uniref:gas vesicle protein GvpO n=1 Tax=Streptomyces sp. NPDC048664 TaxID=3154505 RepID=UPI00341E0C44
MSTTKKDDGNHESGSRSDDAEEERLDLPTVIRQAGVQLSALLQHETAAVSSVRATDDGWSAQVEVVELERVPDTMSVMATYHIELDAKGRLLAYERIRRYARGQIDRR